LSLLDLLVEVSSLLRNLAHRVDGVRAQRLEVGGGGRILLQIDQPSWKKKKKKKQQQQQ